MFSQEQRDMTLASSLVDNVMCNLHGFSFRGDVSMVATLRALLYERVSECDVELFRSTYSFDQWNTHSLPQMFGALSAMNRRAVGFDVIRLTQAGTDAERIFNRISDLMPNEYPTVKEAPDLEKFCAPVFKARIFVNKEAGKLPVSAPKLPSLVVVDSDFNLKSHHMLQSIIPRLMPWVFAEKPLTDEERALLASLVSKSPAGYRALIEEVAKKIDLRQLAIHSILGGFEKRAIDGQISVINNKITEIRRTMEEINSRYESLLQNMDEQNIRLLGLETKKRTTSDDSELIELFSSMPNLTPVETSGTSLTFVARTYLNNFDVDMYETYARNKNSHIYYGYDRPVAFREDDDIKLFLDAVFSDEPRLKVKMCAVFVLNTNGSVDSIKHYNFPQEFNDCMRNAHLNEYNCLGNNLKLVRSRLADQDMIGAIMQCVASAGSQNVGEGTTMRYFLRDLFGSAQRIIELPDGTSVTPAEALAWLKKEDQHE